MPNWKLLLVSLVLLLSIIATKILLYDASPFAGTKLAEAFPVTYEDRFFWQRQQIPTAPFSSFNKAIHDYQRQCHEEQKHCIFFANQEFFAVLHRLSDVQYVGSMIHRDEVPYFVQIVDSLTQMTPYWGYPYIFAQMFGPVHKTALSVDEADKHRSWQESAQLGERGTYFTCDLDKVERIANLSEEDFLYAHKNKQADLLSPCEDYRLPHNLAFTYFYYLKDYTNAQKRYRVAAFDPESPEVTASMSALVAGSLGYHLTSMSLRFEKYSVLFQDITGHGASPDLLLEAEHYVHKAVMEYSLFLIQEADKLAQVDYICFRDLSCLKDNGYLAQVIQQEYNTCISSRPEDITKQHACLVLDYSLEKGFIVLDGSLYYPLSDQDSGASYGWHPVLENRWVIKT